MNNPLVSVIINNWNGKEDTIRAINSFLNSSYKNIEIIFVDMDSEDGSFEEISKIKGVKAIQAGANLGFGNGVNLGYKYSKGDFIFTCDADVEVGKDCFKKLVEAAEKNPEISIFAPVEYNREDRRTIQLLGMSIDFLGYPYPMHHKINLENIEDKQIFYFSGSSLFIRREVIENIGLFDKDIFMFAEDLDFCWRAQLAGYKFKLVKDADFYHKGGAKVGDKKEKLTYNVVRKRYWTEKNLFHNMLKNFQVYTLILNLPFYFCSSLAEIIFFLAQGKPAVSVSYVKAWLWNIKNLDKIIKKRRDIRKIRKVSDFGLYRKLYFGSAKLFTARKEDVKVLN